MFKNNKSILYQKKITPTTSGAAEQRRTQEFIEAWARHKGT
jgi:hypothetical protein